MEEIVEGKTRIRTHLEKVVTKKMPVFYNPEKKFDRDISIDFLRAVGPEKFVICDLLAGTGVRGIRMSKEVGVGTLILNDANPKAAELIKKNLKLNKIKNAEVFCESANLFLLKEKYFYEYLDIDPFGSPVPFLENGIKKVRQDGFLAITATDSATLVGAYPEKSRRIYGAINFRTDFKHEVGLRILIKKAIEVGASQEKALIPVFAHRTRHYFRAYFQVKRNRRSECDKLLSQIGYIQYDRKTMERGIYRPGEKAGAELIGPLWLGKIGDEVIISRMASPLANRIREETQIDVPWYFHIHKIAHLLGTIAPETDILIEKLRNSGFKASRTHFEPLGIKTDANLEEIKKVMR